MLIIGGSGSGKTNLLLNLVENQPDIDQIYLYTKDPYQAKYQYLVNKREGVGINHLNDRKAFIEYSNDMHHFYKNINYYNPDKENKILIWLLIWLLIWGKKWNISLVFTTQSYFKVPKDVRLNTTHFFISKLLNKRGLREIAINHSSDISAKDFINIYRKCTVEPYSVFFTDTKLASNNPLRFRENLFNICIKNHDN